MKKIIAISFFTLIFLGISAWLFSEEGQAIVQKYSQKMQAIAKVEETPIHPIQKEVPKPVTRAIPVVLASARVQHFEEMVKVYGTLKAKNFALVAPRIAGVLEAVFVREGDDVVAGVTKLFQTDSLKLSKALEINRQSFNVARCNREEREAYLEKTEAEFRKADKEFRRYKELYEQRLVSQDEFEQKATAYEQQAAMKKHANSLLALAKEEENKAAIAITISKKDLEDSLMLAPINGKVSNRMAEPGEWGKSDSPVIRIDDTTVLEASAHLPSQYYAYVDVKKTKVRITSYGYLLGEYIVSYKSPVINATLRTFEIKCEMPGDGQRSIPGALIEMTLILNERQGLGVPWESVQERSGRKIIFTVANDAAASVAVQTGIENDGWIEIVSGNIHENSPIVMRGQFLLNHGSLVKIQKGTN